MLVRYFAAARAATGIDEEHLDVGEGMTLGDLEGMLALRHPAAADGQSPLGQVLPRCSFLRNGIATNDRARALSPDDRVDVLPPFAGG
jgi:molybdopterin synthase sulfur carrier subunit